MFQIIVDEVHKYQVFNEQQLPLPLKLGLMKKREGTRLSILQLIRWTCKLVSR